MYNFLINGEKYMKIIHFFQFKGNSIFLSLFLPGAYIWAYNTNRSFCYAEGKRTFYEN